MERTITGQIDFDGVTYSRALQRFVEKRICRWISDSGLAQASAGPEFVVVFSRQGPGHTVYCQLEVRANGESWSGARYGSSPQEALAGTLAHLSERRDAPRIYAYAFSGKRRFVQIPLLQLQPQ